MSEEAIEQDFTKAVELIASGDESGNTFDVTTDDKLALYGLFKQVRDGACNTPEPSMFNLQARAKWQAWQRVSTKSKTQAMQDYLAIIDRLAPGWRTGEIQNAQPSDDPSKRELSFWGWGYADFELDTATKEMVEIFLKAKLGDISPALALQPPTLNEIELRPPRFALPAVLQPFCTADLGERVIHTFGQSFRDMYRAITNQFTNPPDYVAFPRSTADINTLFTVCSRQRIACVPFGGGTSVVGGIESPSLPPNSIIGVIIVDMKRHFDKVLTIDKGSNIAVIQAGILGPALEARLKEDGLTLRHFPQSFEFSTLGGWLATHAGGHFSTVATHIDDMCEALTIVTPTQGTIDTRQVPFSGAGPSEKHVFLGSEGVLGIITEARMRVQKRPIYRCNMSVFFDRWEDAVTALREVSQSGLNPQTARLVDPLESAMFMQLGSEDKSVVLLGFESFVVENLNPLMEAALKFCSKGEFDPSKIETKTSGAGERGGTAGQWRNNFIRAPYLRNYLVERGLIVETVETCVSWDNFDRLHKAVTSCVMATLQKVHGPGAEKIGFVTCRVTHIYPDGPAPYFTIVSRPDKPGNQLQIWDTVKANVSKVLLECKGTITHHHAVGTDHRPYYHQELSPGTLSVLQACKREIDPAGILNPQGLIPAQPQASHWSSWLIPVACVLPLALATLFKWRKSFDSGT
eukprot:m.19022 g.19022  ORF g.19022 m.19022 type:complete len:690 (-) comp12153_c0_seq1:49-2118(-)